MWRIVTNSDLLEEMQRQTSLLHALYKEQQTIRRLLFRLTKPGEMKTRLVGERRINDMDILSYEVTLPAVPAGASVESQRLDITIDGVTTSREPALTDTIVAMEAPQDSAVKLELVYIDEAAVESTKSTLEWTAVDTIPPPQPGEMSVQATGERREE